MLLATTFLSLTQGLPTHAPASQSASFCLALPHSQYAAAAATLADSAIKLANVDATEETELASRFGVQGFPTLKYFAKGAPAVEYSGPREAAGIVAWLRKRSGPATTAVSTIADVEALQAAAGESGVVFLAFADAPDAPFAASVSSAAAAAESGAWALSAGGNDAALRAAHGVAAGEEALISLNSFPDQAHVISFKGDESAANAEEIGAWAAAAALPAVVVFSPETAPKIFAGALKTHLLLFADTAVPAHASAVSAFAAAAAVDDTPVLFVRVPPSEERVVSYFAIAAEDMPTAVLVHMGDSGMKKYKMTGDVAAAATFSGMVADYEAGSLKPWLKSEPAPDAATNDASSVRVVTGGTFDAEIGGGRDVLLEVYAPWCGHCKALAPKYEALGAAVKAAGLGATLSIAKMDGTANEVDLDGFDVQGFPTLFFFKAGSKTPLTYEGPREVAAMTSFIKEHSLHPTDSLAAPAAVDVGAADAGAEDDEGDEDMFFDEDIDEGEDLEEDDYQDDPHAGHDHGDEDSEHDEL